MIRNGRLDILAYSAEAVGKGNFTLNDEAEYVCGSCGEPIVIPIDYSSGSRQDYVEDCPVCCCPNVIHLEIDESGSATVWAELE